MVYYPTGVCAQEISIEVQGEVIQSVSFKGGCNGNSQGISKLVEGTNIDDAISRMQGIRCGRRSTSCPDQLATALKKIQTLDQ